MLKAIKSINKQDIKENIKQLFTINYYKNGFSNWTKLSYIWLAIGLAVLLVTGLLNSINTNTIISVIGGLIGFSCTLAISNNKRINGLLGFVSAILISYVAMTSTNYSEIVMQMVYLLFLDLPVILFGDAWQKKEIKKMDKQGWFIMAMVFIISFGLLYLMDTHVFISHRPLIDAISAAIGVTGSALMLGKYSSQYVWWSMQGIMSITLWGITAFSGDSDWVLFMTYILYLGNDAIGLFASPWSHPKK